MLKASEGPGGPPTWQVAEAGLISYVPLLSLQKHTEFASAMSDSCFGKYGHGVTTGHKWVPVNTNPLLGNEWPPRRQD